MICLTRRDFLRLCGTSSLGLALAACGVAPTPIATPAPTNTALPSSTPTLLPTATLTNMPVPTSTATATATIATPQVAEKWIIAPTNPLTVENYRTTYYQMPIAGSTTNSLDKSVGIKISMTLKGNNKAPADNANGMMIDNSPNNSTSTTSRRRIYLNNNGQQWSLTYQDDVQSKLIGKIGTDANPYGEFEIQLDPTGTKVSVIYLGRSQSFTLPQSLHYQNLPITVYSQTAGLSTITIEKLSILGNELFPEKIPADALRYAFDKRGLTIGVAAGSWSFRDSPKLASTVAEYNLLHPEGEFDWGWLLRPSPTVYDFSSIDNLINFARQNKMQFRGEVLYGSGNKPQWLIEGNYSRDQLVKIMNGHITTVVSRYKSIIKEWRINEYWNWDTQGTPKDFWYKNIGPEYIDMAADTIRAIDPDALIILNYFAEAIVARGRSVSGKRTDMIFEVAKRLRQNGHRVAMGWEGHLYADGEKKSIKEDLKTEMRRAAKEGISFMITEADDPLDQERTFREMVEAGLEINTEFGRSAFLGITFWGVDAGHSWLRRPNMSVLVSGGPNSTPLPFDANYQRTKGWYAVNAAVSGR